MRAITTQAARQYVFYRSSGFHSDLQVAISSPYLKAFNGLLERGGVGVGKMEHNNGLN